MSCCGAKNGMKLKGKAIAEEREKERERERDAAQYNPPTAIIEHFSHPHPLTYTETNHSEFRCNVCKLRGNRKRYHCARCEFNLHTVCAQSSLTWLLPDKPADEIKPLVLQQQNVIHGSFAHPEDSLVAEYSRRSFKCDHCNNYGEGLRFQCDACNVRFHQICAKHPTKLTSFLHEHELELKLRSSIQRCNLCDNKGPKNSFMYRCKGCWFNVHPDCIEWPLYVVHPLHPNHPLVLQSCAGYTYKCSVCNWKIDGYKYSCLVCELDFDPACIRRKAQLGFDEEVEQKYGGKVVMLPITNLSSPYELSVSHLDSPSPGIIDPTSLIVPFVF